MATGQELATTMKADHGVTAIEVATMLGDSVVGVTYVGAPEHRGARHLTYALIALGVTGVILSIAALGHAFHIASVNHDALVRWLGVEHRPIWAFRPKMIGLGTEIAAFAGFGVGLTALTAALVRVRATRRKPTYRIGTAPTVDAPTLGVPSDNFPLVTSAGDYMVFNYGAGIDGEVVANGITTPLAALTASGRARPSNATVGAIELPIPAHGKIRARVGQTTFWISAVAAPRAPATGFAFDNRLAAYFGASLVVHFAVWAMLAQIPLEGTTANLGLDTSDGVNGRTSRIEQDDPVPPPQPNSETAGDSAPLAGAAMALPSGAAGGDKTPTGAPAPGTANQSAVAVSRDQAVANARELLASEGLRSAISQLALSDTSMLDGLDGNQMYDATTDDIGGGPGFGHGLHGGGAGGGGAGGTGWGTVALGGYGDLGRCGAHCGDGYAIGGGHGGHGPGRTGMIPSVVMPAPTTVGDLDKAIIRRYINRNLDKIKYCYEKQLLAQPTLEGTLRVDFFISPNGSVASASGKGVDPAVASCVTGVISAIAFPRPGDGGGVNVSYPFTFRAAQGTN